MVSVCFDRHRLFRVGKLTTIAISAFAFPWKAGVIDLTCGACLPRKRNPRKLAGSCKPLSPINHWPWDTTIRFLEEPHNQSWYLRLILVCCHVLIQPLFIHLGACHVSGTACKSVGMLPPFQSPRSHLTPRHLPPSQTSPRIWWRYDPVGCASPPARHWFHASNWCWSSKAESRFFNATWVNTSNTSKTRNWVELQVEFHIRYWHTFVCVSFSFAFVFMTQCWILLHRSSNPWTTAFRYLPPSEGEGHAVGLWEIGQGAVLHMAKDQLSLTFQFGGTVKQKDWKEQILFSGPFFRRTCKILESQDSLCPPSVALSKCWMYLDAIAILST